VSVTLDGIVITWNQGAERLYGYSAEEMIGYSVSILTPPDRQHEYREVMEKVKQKEKVPTFDTARLRKDGTIIEVSLSMTPIAIRRGNVASSSKISHDITRIKFLERQFQQAQKMEAIGTLAGGVAHDFNNILTVINAYCELIIEDGTLGDASRNMVHEMWNAGLRATALTRQLLAFSRKQILEPQVLDLNDVVSKTESLFRHLIGEYIVVSLILKSTLRKIKADPGKIEQILMNLMVNAKDAMPQGGTLTIETKNVTLDQAYCQSHPGARPGEFVLMTVSDSGTGMDEKTKTHVFEPFFTTKAVGKGTGLGLAMVFGITKQSGGYVDVESELWRGTTFSVYLPHTTDVPVESSQHMPMTSPMGQETLLLVEDDAPVRALAQRILQSCGYNVLAATDGQDAIRISEDYRGAIDLLVTDVVMPHLSGGKLAEKIVELRPSVKVLYLSGYTDDSVVRHGVNQAEFAFLQKPFTALSLAQKVREVLDAH